MGIDVYLLWDGQTEKERNAQYTGFSIVSGHVGYLREAYHGSPYATQILINEDWGGQPKGGFAIPNANLQQRLPAAVKAAIIREGILYRTKAMLHDPHIMAFANFVALHGQLEAQGRNPRILVSY